MDFKTPYSDRVCSVGDKQTSSLEDIILSEKALLTKSPCPALSLSLPPSLHPSLRLYGGYESLKGGKTSEAMEDFTGGLVESFELKDDIEGLFQKIEKSIKQSSLMSCSIKAVAREDMEAKLTTGKVM